MIAPPPRARIRLPLSSQHSKPGGGRVYLPTRALLPHPELLLEFDPLLLPFLHGLVPLRRQRRDVRLEVDVLLRVRIHRLTAEKDRVSHIVENADRRHEPGSGDPRVVVRGSAEI